MPRNHVVRDGECLQSIAALYGFLPDTIWNDSANAELVQARTHQSVLAPGDVLVIPDLRIKSLTARTGKRHVFRRRSVPTGLRVQLVLDDTPRAELSYELTIGGKTTTRELGQDGVIEAFIPSDAASVTLVLDRGGEFEQTLEIKPGQVQPVVTDEGVRQRLQNLGYFFTHDQTDPYVDPQRTLRAALRLFQEDHGLDDSGVADSETQAALLTAHGY